jgi:beta-N-acetylhexosaminidase
MKSSRLTLEEKVGQLFFLGIQSSATDLESRLLIESIRPGGFVLFQRNIESFDQAYALNNRLRDIGSVPAFLAIEQEGVRVDRLKHIFAPVPAELESLGFNVNFAPGVDISVEGSVLSGRTLSSVPAEVSRIASVFVEEHTKKNIVSCAKHFPGMGSAVRDPHFVLPSIARTKRQIVQDDITPFIALRNDVGMIMLSHAHYPGLTDDRAAPAWMSSKVVDRLLRRKLGFQGVVVTADLTMGAATSIGLTPELFLRAFEAGNDMLVFSQTTPLVGDAFTTVLGAVRASPRLRQQLDESVERIIRLKSRLELPPLRHRAHLRGRIARQIERLTAVLGERRTGMTPVKVGR